MAARDTDDSHLTTRCEKFQSVSCSTLAVSSGRAQRVELDSPLVLPSREPFGQRPTSDVQAETADVRQILQSVFRVSECGRELAINLFEQHLVTSTELLRQLRSLSGRRLVCHFSRSQSCHADALIRTFSSIFPEAYDRETSVRPPTSAQLNLLAMHGEEPQSEEGSSADEGSPPKGSGWCGLGEPMTVGVGYSCREYCDGRGLASLGRWPVARRRYPDRWRSVVSSYVSFAKQHDTRELLMKLALGKVRECPCKGTEVQELKNEVIVKLASMVMDITRCSGDGHDIPMDFRFPDPC